MFVAPISTDATAPKGTLGDPNDPTILVYPHVVYNGLNAISMLEQTFETDLQLELTWFENIRTQEAIAASHGPAVVP